jgi:hypothetical protein
VRVEIDEPLVSRPQQQIFMDLDTLTSLISTRSRSN